jgi:hypothetical protein
MSSLSHKLKLSASLQLRRRFKPRITFNNHNLQQKFKRSFTTQVRGSSCYMLYYISFYDNRNSPCQPSSLFRRSRRRHYQVVLMTYNVRETFPASVLRGSSLVVGLAAMPNRISTSMQFTEFLELMTCFE